MSFSKLASKGNAKQDRREALVEKRDRQRETGDSGRTGKKLRVMKIILKTERGSGSAALRRG